MNDLFGPIPGDEFAKLALRATRVDWARLSAELAADLDPDVRPDDTLQWIAGRREELLGEVALAWSEADALRRLAACLADRHGLVGDASVLESPDGYFLHRIIDSGRGAPLGLSLLYMSVADAVLIELNGVAAPTYFLTRYESAEGPLFLDAFHGGRLLEADECVAWLAARTQVPPARIVRQLEPASARAVVLRWLTQLKLLHVQREKWQAAWLVQRRLCALQPASFEQRRDLAVLSLKAGHAAAALELLESCLRTAPPEEADYLAEQLAEARRSVAAWN